MEVTQICLVRHGETDWNKEGRIQGRTDTPLNSLGRLQAEKCGKYLAEGKWDLIISSLLVRAKQTAKIISSYLQQPIITLEAFIERDYGEAEGLSAAERIIRFPDRHYPGQESRDSLTKRVMEGIGFIHAQYENKRIILVAHGAVINAILAAVSNGEIGSGKTRLHNACLSKIQFQAEENKWVYLEYNEVHHLAAKEEGETV